MNTFAGGIFRTSLGLLALLSLVACEDLNFPATSPFPEARPLTPQDVGTPPIEFRPAIPSDQSRALATFYQRLQADLLTRGLLRTDGGGPDTVFTDTLLARNFVRIALFDEFVSTPSGLRAQPTISRLRRWEQPVRFAVQYGDSIPLDQRAQDDVTISRYVDRLARVTGHPMSMSDTDPNFHVLILNEDDRLASGDRLRALVPGIDDSSVRAFLDVPRDTLCLVLAFSIDGRPQYSQAVAMIRGEHPDLMRLACVHEELAQGLGLANDSPRARPSIFNDDEEFALLTTHDELLLKMLYDPRLETGMEASQAAPIARVIARELMNSGPS